ncbi:MAG TPA: hypothetical protein VES65_01825 [Solirubrobacteraceae bacterium]|nr:hypothetical protein [Solirubrobacteraceae bacterium]
MLTPRLTPGAEHGVTLVELVVAMATGVVVTGALLAIVVISLRQEARITDKAQADQIGRTAMSNVVDELHSSCTGFGAAAIQGPASTPTSPLAATGPVNLWFLSAYGGSSSGAAVLSGVTEHDINWTSTGTSDTGETLGTLTDYAFASTGGASPKWTFPTLSVANAKARVLAKNVIPPQVSGAATVFQFYKYDNNSASSTDGQLVALAAGELPVAQATAEKAQAAAKTLAKVTIGFTQAPEGQDTRIDRTASFASAVVLHFDTSETGSEVVNSPCE